MLIAEVTAEQLIMSESEIATRIDLAGPEKVITIYISEGNDPIYNNRAWNEPVPLSRVPEDWQYEYISTNTKKVSNFIDLTFFFIFRFLFMRFSGVFDFRFFWIFRYFLFLFLIFWTCFRVFSLYARVMYFDCKGF